MPSFCSRRPLPFLHLRPISIICRLCRLPILAERLRIIRWKISKKRSGKSMPKLRSIKRVWIKNSKKSNCDSVEKEKAKLKYLRSEAAIVKAVFKPLGGGIPPFTNSGSWMEKHKFKAQPARYKTSFGDSIFKVFPSDYLDDQRYGQTLRRRIRHGQDRAYFSAGLHLLQNLRTRTGERFIARTGGAKGV